MPYIEKQNIYQMIDMTKSYRDITAGYTGTGGTGFSVTAGSTTATVNGNTYAALTNIPTFVCPSNPFSTMAQRDPAGFGGTDYFATVYTDIDPATGLRNTSTRMDGALTVVDGHDTGVSGTASDFTDGMVPTSVPISAISDGTSNTIAVIEDAGRVAPASGTGVPYYTLSGYDDTQTTNLLPTDVTQVGGGQALRGVWRWADPDATGSGISGPPNAIGLGAGSNPSLSPQVISQNAYPIGGPALSSGQTTTQSSGNQKGTFTSGTGCPWTVQNCGANDEPFSFHTGGCNCVMVDGSVRFLSSSLDPITIRCLVTRSEGIEVPNTSNYAP